MRNREEIEKEFSNLEKSSSSIGGLIPRVPVIMGLLKIQIELSLDIRDLLRTTVERLTPKDWVDTKK